MFRDLLPEDKTIFLSMVNRFYQSDAVAYKVDVKNFVKTFEAAMSHSPFLRILMIEEMGVPIGYALLSLTYSNEVGGMVIWVEELYIGETYRSKGLASKFFAFLSQEYPLAKRFRLEVRADNIRAIDLYQRHGFHVFDYVQMVKDK